MTLLVVGNAVIDVTYRLERLPAPGETVLAGAREAEVGGKGLNQAVVAHRAGLSTRLVAAVGADPGGELVRSRLADEGMTTEGLQTLPDAATDESVVLVAGSGENAIISTATAAGRLPESVVQAEIARMLPGEILLLQGNLGRSLTEAALRRGRAEGLTLVLNAAPVAFDYAGLLGLVDVLIVNEVEAAELPPDGPAAVIVTAGARGARLIEGGRSFHLPAAAATAVDTSGAGDVVCGVLAAGLARAVGIPTALRWALDAATLKVTRQGAFAGLPRAEELARLAP